MDKITVTLPSDTVSELDDRVGGEYESRSEAVRELLDRGLRYEDRVPALEAERDRFQRELRASNARQDDVGELVEYVEAERAIQQRREERQREREAANIFRKTWWAIAGRPTGD